MSALYNPAKHRIDDRIELLDFVRSYPFATLVSAKDGEPSISHLPMLVHKSDADSNPVLHGHLAKANEHWKEIGKGSDATAIFHGPQAYVTPQWYPSKLKHGKVVPTWNYSVVHAQGRIRTVNNRAWLHKHVSALTDQHEKEFAHRWYVTDAPEDFVERMLRVVVGLEMTIHKIEGKWKLNQNLNENDRIGVAGGLASRADADSQAVSALMRNAGR